MEPPVESATGDAERGADVSRRRLLAIGLPAVITVAAAGSATMLLVSRTERRDGIVDPVSSSPSVAPSVAPPDLFTQAESSGQTSATVVAILPGSTTSTVPTSTVPTTSSPSSSTPSSTSPATTVTPRSGTTPATPTRSSTLPRPVPPPSDPRGHEEQIRLGTISIPSLGVEAPLLEGIRLTTLDNGPGHWPGSAMPGAPGNVVVAAHRTSHGAAFRHIDQLVAGEAVVFTTDAGESHYEVTGTQVVDPDALWITDPTEEPTATLFACHPPGSVAQRIVVTLELAA